MIFSNSWIKEERSFSSSASMTFRLISLFLLVTRSNASFPFLVSPTNTIRRSSSELYDDRDDLSLNGLQSDIFNGVRLGFNDVKDTQVLMGAIFDVNRSTELYFIEGSRRIGSSWKGVIEARLFENVDPSEFTFFIRDDSFLQASLTKYF